MNRVGRTILVVSLIGLTLFSLVLLIWSLLCPRWDAAAVGATLFVGMLAADVVFWQSYLIKRQLAFSTYLDLGKEWNSPEMIEARKSVHAPDSEHWDDSRLEAILEFFEKLAKLFKISGDTSLIYESSLGWYAAHYFLFARQHGRIQHLRDLWQDYIYEDVEEFYRFYLAKEAGWRRKTRLDWEAKRLEIEPKFWAQERKD
jgi:hypothetical protein